MLASVFVRQYVEGHWSKSSRFYKDGDTLASEPDREVLREMLPSGLADGDPKIRSMMAASIALMAHYDWPAKWPSVFHDLVDSLSSGNPDLVHGCLRCLESFATSMKEEHMGDAIPLLATPLLTVFANEDGVYSPRDQARAVKIYASCLATLFHVKKKHPDAAAAILEDSLPSFMEGVYAVLQMPDALDDDCGIKIEAVRLLNLVMLRYTSLAADLVGPCLPAVWESLTAAVAGYSAALIDGLPTPPRDEDGDTLGFEHLLVALFDSIAVMSSRETFRPVVQDSLEELTYVLIYYTQLTDTQLEAWEGDPIQFVEDDSELSVKRHSVRLAAMDLVSELLLMSVTGEEFCVAVTLALASSVTRVLDDASSMESGLAWRAKEAAFFVMGRTGAEFLDLISNNTLDFDLESFLSSILLPELQAGDSNAYLLGRSLWLASLFAHKVPDNVSVPFLEASLAGLGADSDLPVRVSATKAMLSLSRRLPKSVLIPYVGHAVEGLVDLATEIGATYERPTAGDADSLFDSPETSSILDAVSLANSRNPMLSLVVDALIGVVHVDAEATAALEESVTPFALAIFISYRDNHILSSSCISLFAAVAECAWAAVFQRVYNLIGSTFTSDGNAGFGFVKAVADLFEVLVEHAPAPMDEGMATLLGALISQALASPDASLMQATTKVLRQYVRVAPDHLSAAIGPENESGADMVLSFVSRLVSDDVSEDGASLVGALIITLFKSAPSVVEEVMDPLLSALLDRLASAQFSPFIQSLVSVFALLINESGPGPVLSMAANHSVGDANGLEVLMAQWLDKELAFTGKYISRLSLTALARLMAPMATEIATLSVPEEVVDMEAGVQTRHGSRGRTMTQVPVPIKIVRVFVAHLGSIQDDVMAGLDPNEEDYDTEDSDDLYEAAGFALRDDDGGFGAGGGGSGRSPFMDADAFMLSDMWNIGLDFDYLDDDADEEYKDDPLMDIKVGGYITAFLQAFAGQDPDTFQQILDHCSGREQELVQQCFAGEFADY